MNSLGNLSQIFSPSHSQKVYSCVYMEFLLLQFVPICILSCLWEAQRRAWLCLYSPSSDIRMH